MANWIGSWPVLRQLRGTDRLGAGFRGHELPRPPRCVPAPPPPTGS